MSESTTARSVSIPAGENRMEGDLVIPAGAQGLVLFAHGSGSGRFSPRNRRVAAVLQDASLATLLLDLLTEAEERLDSVTSQLRFDIPFLANRLLAATEWAASDAATRHLPLGYFGASTGAAAALIAAARRPERVTAVVSRGGRPDLAAHDLENVRAPTLLIVGSLDEAVVAMNQDALRRLRTEKRLEIVAGATHLFEEPGKLDVVAALARDWFIEHFTRATSSGSIRGQEDMPRRAAGAG